MSESNAQTLSLQKQQLVFNKVQKQMRAVTVNLFLVQKQPEEFVENIENSEP